MSRWMMVLSVIVAVAAMWIVAVRPALENQLDEPAPSEPAAPPLQAPPPTAAPEPPVQPAAPAPVAPPEPDPEPAQPAAPAQPNKPFWSDMIKGDQGPVADYRKRYETETRDDAAQSFETHVRAAFEKAKAPPDMLQAVSCHRTICKLTLRWSDARTYDYVKSLTWMNLGGEPRPGRLGFGLPLALSPAGEKGADGVRPVELFVVRQP